MYAITRHRLDVALAVPDAAWPQRVTVYMSTARPSLGELTGAILRAASRDGKLELAQFAYEREGGAVESLLGLDPVMTSVPLRLMRNAKARLVEARPYSVVVDIARTDRSQRVRLPTLRPTPWQIVDALTRIRGVSRFYDARHVLIPTEDWQRELEPLAQDTRFVVVEGTTPPRPRVPAPAVVARPPVVAAPAPAQVPPGAAPAQVPPGAVTAPSGAVTAPSVVAPAPPGAAPAQVPPGAVTAQVPSGAVTAPSGAVTAPSVAAPDALLGGGPEEEGGGDVDDVREGEYDSGEDDLEGYFSAESDETWGSIAAIGVPDAPLEWNSAGTLSNITTRLTEMQRVMENVTPGHFSLPVDGITRELLKLISYMPKWAVGRIGEEFPDSLIAEAIMFDRIRLKIAQRSLDPTTDFLRITEMHREHTEEFLEIFTFQVYHEEDTLSDAVRFISGVLSFMRAHQVFFYDSLIDMLEEVNPADPVTPDLRWTVVRGYIIEELILNAGEFHMRNVMRARFQYYEEKDVDNYLKQWHDIFDEHIRSGKYSVAENVANWIPQTLIGYTTVPALPRPFDPSAAPNWRQAEDYTLWERVDNILRDNRWLGGTYAKAVEPVTIQEGLGQDLPARSEEAETTRRRLLEILRELPGGAGWTEQTRLIDILSNPYVTDSEIETVRLEFGERELITSEADSTAAEAGGTVESSPYESGDEIVGIPTAPGSETAVAEGSATPPEMAGRTGEGVDFDAMTDEYRRKHTFEE